MNIYTKYKEICPPNLTRRLETHPDEQYEQIPLLLPADLYRDVSDVLTRVFTIKGVKHPNMEVIIESFMTDAYIKGILENLKMMVTQLSDSMKKPDNCETCPEDDCTLRAN